MKLWQRVLVVGGIVLLASVFAGAAALDAVRALSALFLVVAGLRRARRDRGPARRPWTTICIGGAITLGSAVIRTGHGLTTGESYPFPSVADLVAYAGYGVMLSGAALLVTSRTVERRIEDLIDALTVAVLAALLVYVYVLDDYLQDASVDLLSRLTNLGYSLLVVTLVGVIARVSFGPGERNGSYYLLASSTMLIVFNDTLTLLDTVGRSWAQPLGSVAGTAAFIAASASVVHPGAMRLADRPRHRDTRLSSRRVLVLFAALVVGPATLALEIPDSTLLDLAVMLGASCMLSVCVLLRMVYLVRSREERADREHALRELGTSLVQSQDRAAVLRTGLDVIEKITSGLDRPASAIFAIGPDGFEPVVQCGGRAGDAFGFVAAADMHDEIRSGVTDGRLVVLEGVAASSALAGGTGEHYIVASPVCQRETADYVVVVDALHVPARETVAAVQSASDQMALALDGLVATEQLHQRRSNRRFRALVENSSDVVLVVDDDAVITFVSPTVRRLLGRDEDDVVGRSILELVHTSDEVHARRLLATPSRPTAGNSTVEARLLHGSGDMRWFELEARDLTDDPEVGGVVVTASDISDRKRAEAQLVRSEARFRLLVQNTSDVVAIIDDNQMITYVSPSVEHTLGFAIAEVLGRNVFELLSVTEAERIRSLSTHDLDGGTLDVRIQGGDGRLRAVEVAVTDMRDQPEVAGTVLNMRDVTERKTLEADLRHRSLHDDLTGLANRTLFSDRVSAAVASTAKGSELVGVLFVDLDDFKLINDSLGHVVGDHVLVTVANRIQHCLRLNDLAARLGGDEFGVLLTAVYGESEVVEVADRLRSSIGEPIHVGEHEFRLTASVGVVIEAGSDRTGEDLLRSADLAMYRAKRGGKDRHELFESQMAVSAVEELELKNALVRAVENQEFVLHYQPIIDMVSARIVGVEALLRWEDPARGMISPASFIPAAEETGIIREIGMWVAGQAADDLARWREMGHDLYCSINVSGRQMTEPSFAQRFVDTVERSGVNGSAIVVELTESVLAVPGTTQMFETFHSHGFRIALDDFGTGYSALQYLQSFDIDLIKIDRSFVTALGETRDTGMVQAVLDLAGSIGATTLAEGIEDTNELQLLKSLGVELGQGYYFSRPLPEDQLLELLADEFATRS